MPVLRAELQKVAQHWNLHKIRPSKSEDSPAGRPDVLYFIPEADDRESYLSEVPEKKWTLRWTFAVRSLKMIFPTVLESLREF